MPVDKIIKNVNILKKTIRTTGESIFHDALFQVKVVG